MSRLHFVAPSLAVALVGLSFAACKDKASPAAPAPSASIAAAPTASVPPATTDAGGDMTARADAGTAGAARMANCPTAAPGATVAMKDVEGGIEISIVGKDEGVTSDIKSRMAKLVEADKNEADAGIKHDHSGGGGGIYGRCTVVMRNTKLETADIPGGVKATVKAKSKSEVDWLRRETRERDADAKMPGVDGAGAHRMGHCPSAAPGAKTVVKDAKDGVVIVVTGTGDAVKEIRERAKHTADIAKLPEPPKVEHNSEGNGGGGMGRCPVIVEGDNTVDVKEIDGGAEITVKAKKDVPALQKEARLRAENFSKK